MKDSKSRFALVAGYPGTGVCVVIRYEGKERVMQYAGWYDVQRQMWLLYPRFAYGEFRKDTGRLRISLWDVTDERPRRAGSSAKKKSLPSDGDGVSGGAMEQIKLIKEGL